MRGLPAVGSCSLQCFPPFPPCSRRALQWLGIACRGFTTVIALGEVKDLRRLLLACIASAVVGLAVLVAVMLYYGPARVFAFELVENDGRLVTVSGTVEAAPAGFPWRVTACDLVCFTAVAPAKLASRTPPPALKRGDFISVTGFVRTGGSLPEVMLAGEDSLAVVR